jgi:hypothetical protein
MSKMNNNRVPVAEKTVKKQKYEFDFSKEPSLVDIDPETQKELDSKGLVGKYINATKLRANFGTDPRGWRPYKPDVKGSLANTFGADPEGYVRRGDLILAVLPKEQHARLKAKVQYRTDMQSSASQRQKAAQELQQTVGSAAKVKIGYDENED